MSMAKLTRASTVVHGRGKANHDIDLPEGKIILLSVQCYTLTEYKFTCMCVCPSHFLSTRLGQTSQRIFTVDSLTDADLRKDVPFGGLGDE